MGRPSKEMLRQREEAGVVPLEAVGDTFLWVLRKQAYDIRQRVLDKKQLTKVEIDLLKWVCNQQPGFLRGKMFVAPAQSPEAKKDEELAQVVQRSSAGPTEIDPGDLESIFLRARELHNAGSE